MYVNLHIHLSYQNNQIKILTMENLTNNQNLNAVLRNAFKIVRNSTKRRKDFISNHFERPVTTVEFFRLLSESKIENTSYENMMYMLEKFASDYVNNYKSTVTLVISENSSYIKFKSGSTRSNISLNNSAIQDTWKWFGDREIFHTDYGTLSHSNNYYK